MTQLDPLTTENSKIENLKKFKISNIHSSMYFNMFSFMTYITIIDLVQEKYKQKKFKTDKATDEGALRVVNFEGKLLGAAVASLALAPIEVIRVRFCGRLLTTDASERGIRNTGRWLIADIK